MYSNDKPWKKLYKRKAWQILRERQLSLYPLCRMHKQIGKTMAASVVDHIRPHKGDETLFFSPENLQSLCKPCHDRHKQRQERGGVLVGGDTEGKPLDPLHHWNL